MPEPIDEILIDARGLEPPEPLERILQALPRLEAGSQIRMLLHREPFPLYVILDDAAYLRETVPQPDGSYVVLIRKAPPA